MTTIAQLETERSETDARLAELCKLDARRRRELEAARAQVGAVSATTEPPDLVLALADVEALVLIVAAVGRELDTHTQRRRRIERRLTTLRERRGRLVATLADCEAALERRRELDRMQHQREFVPAASQLKQIEKLKRDIGQVDGNG